VHGSWKVAKGCPLSTCWVSWEKIRTCTIYTPCEAERACFPRIGPTLSSTLGGLIPGKARGALLYIWDSSANVMEFFWDAN